MVPATACRQCVCFLTFWAESAPAGSTSGCVVVHFSSAVRGCCACQIITTTYNLSHRSFNHSFVSQTNSPWIQDKWLFIHFVKFVYILYKIHSTVIYFQSKNRRKPALSFTVRQVYRRKAACTLGHSQAHLQFNRCTRRRATTFMERQRVRQFLPVSLFIHQSNRQLHGPRRNSVSKGENLLKSWAILTTGRWPSKILGAERIGCGDLSNGLDF